MAESAAAGQVSSTSFSADREWEMGVAAERRGDCNGALRRFSALERKGRPPTSAAYRAMGRCRMRQGDDRLAASAFVSAMKEEKYRKDPEMHRMLTEAHFRQGRCDLAENSAMAGLLLFPKDPTLLGQLARCRKTAKEEAKEGKEEVKEEAKEEREEARETEKEIREETREEVKAGEEETKEESKEVREEAREEEGEAKETGKDAKAGEKKAGKQAKKRAKEAKEKSKEAGEKAKEGAKAAEEDSKSAKPEE